MAYKVIHPFFDLQDKERHTYKVGDPFPHKGEVSEKRVAELTGNKNKLGKPVIELVEEVETKPKRTRKKKVTESEG